jgi:hypothetical protein
MVRYKASASAHPVRWWRLLLSGVLVLLAVVTLLAAIVTRYTKDNLLDTDQYVSLVGPLPQDPQVAAALGTFTAERLFNSGYVEGQIEGFLPDKLTAAAPLLSEALEQQVATITQNIVTSNVFVSTWEQANRISHERLMRVAHSEPVDGEQLRAETTLALDGLFSKVRERLGDDPILSEAQKGKASALKVDLQQTVEELRRTVGWIETGAWALPLIAFVLLGAAILAATNRRIAVMTIGITLVLASISMLAVFKLGSGHFLESIQQPVYRDAAQVVYDALFDNLRTRLILLMVVGFVITFLSLFFGPYRWALATRQFLHLTPKKAVHRRHHT